MVGCPLPPLLQNRACDFHRTRLLSKVIFVIDTVLWSNNSLWYRLAHSGLPLYPTFSLHLGIRLI